MLRDFDALRGELEATGFEFVRASVRQHLSEEELIRIVPEFDGTICGGDRYTARVLDAAPRLRVICKWGTGIDAIDQEACRERGVALRNVADAFSVPVADHAMGMMLALSRRLFENDRRVREGRWSAVDGVSLAECRLGIVGFGNIGRTLARRARAFGMQIVACDPVEPAAQVLDDTGARMVGLDDLLETSDFVSLNCDLNPTSRGLLNAERIGRMKAGAFVINTARGGVVEQAALVRALIEGRLGGAGLDVFEDEPLPAESPLVRMPNVILTPHIANSSPRAAWATHRRCIANLVELMRCTPRRVLSGARS
jgi:D-3-phosphoglycerate dehydrogenase